MIKWIIANWAVLLTTLPLLPIGGWLVQKGTAFVNKVNQHDTNLATFQTDLTEVKEDVKYVRGRVDALTDHLISAGIGSRTGRGDSA